MIGLGGSIQNANCEVHSMQFMIANSIEETYEEMKQRWFGDSLHIDSYTEIKYIDGYQIDMDSNSDLNPYMVVYGGYQKGVIDELHDYSIVLANSKEDAKKDMVEGQKYQTEFYEYEGQKIQNTFQKTDIKWSILKYKIVPVNLND